MINDFTFEFLLMKEFSNLIKSNDTFCYDSINEGSTINQHSQRDLHCKLEFQSLST